ncbi:MAG: PAS domain S-box protein [Desulfobacterales bacterium]|uniref:histidine kinase n=1 Tax=Candidatus Desulfatibia vada TaxID=2841696 RepID=A0A8J6TRL8_9BACT|nr:PAS domain S-box protein [Candidatus Desulfatibia vada]
MKELESKAAPAPQNHRALDASKRSAKALWENKEIFQCISSAAQDAIIMMDSFGNVAYWNEAAERIFGYSKNEIIGKQLHHMIMPARHLAAFDRAFARFKKTGRGKVIGKTLELAALRKDGLEFPVELSLSAVKLQGEWCAVGIIRDIAKRKLIEEELLKAHSDLEHRVKERTAELVMANEQLKREIEERKGIETALRVSKERFDLAVRGSKDGLWDWHITTNKLYASRRLRELLGYQDSEFSESFGTWASNLHLGDYNRVLDALHDHLEKGEIYDVEYLYRNRVGQYRWHHSRGQAIYDKEGTPIRMVGFISDITERKQGEEALRKSEEKYRLLLNNLPSIVYRGFKDWAVEFVDNKIELLTGFNKEEFNSKRIKWSDLIIKEDLETARYSFLRALKTDKSYVREYRIKTKAGEVHWMQDRGQILCDKNGQIEYVSGVFFDINESKRTEEALQKSEKELRILSSQLLSAEEAERKRIARELHDGIGQALSAIKFSVENTLEELRKEAVYSKFESLESIIPLTQKTIEEVRRIVRDLRPSILDDLGILATIAWFCREFESIYSTIRVEKEITVNEHEIPATLKTVIYRIMQEAFNNAAKYSQADLIRFYLKKTGDKIELTINDTGQGFDIEETVYDKHSMRGFGLASMKERAELSGGSFTIKSAKGAGTNIQAIWPV